MPYAHWIYQAVQYSSMLVSAAVFIAGLVIALRRWHVSPAARLTAESHELREADLR